MHNETDRMRGSYERIHITFVCTLEGTGDIPTGQKRYLHNKRSWIAPVCYSAIPTWHTLRLQDTIKKLLRARQEAVEFRY